MSDVWSLPGYDVQCRLGSGPTGEVWRAVELATGETVALRRLPDGIDGATADALLQGLDTPYVVRLRAVVAQGSEAVLVLDHAAGGSLAALLARRGALDPGEVVTVAAPVALGLAAAHARGLVHGHVTPATVLFTADGMPLLSGLGLSRGGEPAADVWALAAVCHHLLVGAPPHTAAGERTPLGLLAPAAPRDLVAVVEAALVADPADRPAAALFAALLRRAHPPAPVHLSGGPPCAGGAHVRRRRRPPAPVLTGAAACLLIALAAAGGWQLGRTGGTEGAALPPVAGSTLASPTPSPDWSRVLDGLDAARAQAFSAGDVAALARVWAPRSPGLASDTLLLQGLVERGETASGLRHEVRSVEVLADSRLRITDVLATYQVLGAAGDVVRRVPARGERSFLVELARTPAGWRLVEVRPA